MKKLLLVTGIILLGIGFLVGKWSDSIQKSDRSLPDSLSSDVTGPHPEEQIPASHASGFVQKDSPRYSSSEAGQILLVSRVIDGDTIELENGDRVRYIGIDTPETVDPRSPVQCFGVEASRRNRELVEGKRVWLIKDVTDKDRYGRFLRYVYLGDPKNPDTIFVNLELVREGFAHSYSYPPDIAHQEEFVRAESDARGGQKGLWGPKCLGGNITPFISPQPGDTAILGDQHDPSCKIKGNISSTGEKIYHLPGCGSYEKTQIDEGRGERWFCSEDEAVSAGWRKAKNC